MDVEAVLVDGFSMSSYGIVLNVLFHHHPRRASIWTKERDDSLLPVESHGWSVSRYRMHGNQATPTELRGLGYNDNLHDCPLIGSSLYP